ncbi:hypothetical protein LTR87_009939 [Friedmanniomyces endolithicus]|nr:hypothetical protein LTR87_009939 [Friedmanniomyces endolithicus]
MADRRRPTRHRKAFDTGNSTIHIRVGSRRNPRRFNEILVSGPRDAPRFARLVDDQVRAFPRDPLVISINGYQPWLEEILSICIEDYWSNISDLDREVQFAGTMQFPERANKRGQNVPWTFVSDHMNVPQVYDDSHAVDELDPLRDSKRPYRDNASHSLRSIVHSEKYALLGSPPRRTSRRWSRLRFCCFLLFLFIVTIFLLLSAGGLWVYKAGASHDGESEPWYPSPRGGTVQLWSRSYRRAAELVGQMTLVEKVNITTGTGWSMGMCVGNTGPVDRLGFPSLCLQDGPLGLRFVDNATALPAGITVAASWNKQLMYDRGRAQGLEARLKGINVILGPSRSGVASALAGLDMSMPGDGLGWQDGKSLWGSDLTKAVLNSSVPVERLDDMVLRIVAAWYQYGQDDDRRWPNSTLGGGPNFSSWTNDEIGDLHPGSPDSKDTGIVNKFVPVRQTAEGGNHDALARRIATEGIVLVKNEGGILPIPRSANGLATKAKDGKLRVGIFGEDAYPNSKGINACPDRGCNEGTLAMGWGSGAVELPYLVSPAEALHREFDNATVQVTDWKTNSVRKVDGTAAAQDLCLVFINSDAGEGFIRWKTVMGDRNDLLPQKGGDELVREVAANCGGRTEGGEAVSDTIVVLHTVGPTVLERWIDIPGVMGVLIAHLPGQESGNALTDVLFGDYNPSGRLPYTIGKSEADYGPDSKILTFPNGATPQQNFTEGLYVDYRYFDKRNITPRYEFGYGLSYTTFKLSGLFIHPLSVVNTSLPAPRSYSDDAVPPHMDPRVPGPEAAVWPQGMRRLAKYVYPYIDNVESAKPNGKYQYPKGYDHYHKSTEAGGGEGGNPDLFTTAASLQLSLTNTGEVVGEAVVQIYVSLPSTTVDVISNQTVVLDTPVRQLRAFEKVLVEPGSRSQVRFSLSRKDVSYWDVRVQNWVVPTGELRVCAGFSSRDVRQCGSFELVGGGGWS